MKQRMTLILVIAALFSTSASMARQEIRLYRHEEGYLGLTTRDVTQTDVVGLQLSREAGVYIEKVWEDSSAADAGLREGDVILEYGPLAVLSVRHLQRLLSDTPMGRTVELKVFRSGQQIETQLTVGKKRSGSVAVKAPWDRPDPSVRVPSGGHFFFFSERPRLGITGAPLTEQMADFLAVPGRKGVLIMEILADGPAKRAGLKAGDVIISVDGQPLDSLSELSRRLKEDRHELEIVRDRKMQRVTVELEIKKQTGIRF